MALPAFRHRAELVASVGYRRVHGAAAAAGRLCDTAPVPKAACPHRGPSRRSQLLSALEPQRRRPAPRRAASYAFGGARRPQFAAGATAAAGGLYAMAEEDGHALAPAATY